MVVYIVVGLVVLAGLVLAYRTLGGADRAPPDARALLLPVLAAAHSAAAELNTLSAAAPLIGARGPATPNPAKALRRQMGGLAQQLETLDVASLDEHDSGAHALLAVAVTELEWAAGMCADDAFDSGEGMRSAVLALCGHAALCLDDASRILVESAPPEEVERVP